MGDQNHCGMDATTEVGRIGMLDSNQPNQTDTLDSPIYRVVSSRLYMRLGDYKLESVDTFNVVLRYIDRSVDNYTVPMPRCTLQQAINLGLITVINTDKQREDYIERNIG